MNMARKKRNLLLFYINGLFTFVYIAWTKKGKKMNLHQLPQKVASTYPTIGTGLCTLSFSFLLILLARSNFDHYARECDFGILRGKNLSAVLLTK